jgi:transposase
MRPNPSSPKSAAKSTKKPAEAVVKDIRRATRRHFSAEDKIRIVLEGLRGEESIAELCRREGIAQRVLPGRRNSSRPASAVWRGYRPRCHQ